MGGNPAFSKYDLDSNMRIVFYPAVIGWILFSFWLADITIRLKQLKNKNE
jgi:heme exporter protein C